MNFDACRCNGLFDVVEMTAHSLASHLGWAEDKPAMRVPSLLRPIFLWIPAPALPYSIASLAPFSLNCCTFRWPLAASDITNYVNISNHFHSDLLRVGDCVLVAWAPFLPLQRASL